MKRRGLFSVCGVAGFSLVEMLVILGIFVLVITLTVPAVTQVQESLNLRNAAQRIEGQLVLARQMALSRNLPILIHFGEEMMLEDGAVPRVTTVGVARHAQPGETGDYVMLDRPIDLPEGMTLSNNPTWSRLSALPEATGVPLRPGRSYTTRVMAFEPNGATTLAPTERWFFTLFSDRRSTDPDSNYVTLVVDPVTGRVFSYQP